jgi:8-oxo-dGTP diphosphatase
MKRSVAAIAVHEGTLFIAKRIPGGDMGGKWEFPGGKAEEGEDAKEALAREMEEEFGVPVTVGRKIAGGSFIHNGTEHTLDAYLVSMSGRRFSLTEHTGWRWARLDEIEALSASGDFTPSDYALLPEIREFLSANRNTIREPGSSY